jgi:hypothetical protein
VKRFQQAHGLNQSGSLELGRAVFETGPRRIDSLLVSVGSGGGGGASSPGASSAAYHPSAGAARAVPAVYVAQGTGATGPTGPAQAPQPKRKRKPTRPRPSSGGGSGATPNANRGGANGASNAGRGSSSGSGSGSGSGGGGASTPVMKTTATRQVVTVELDTGKASVARVGERVSVQLPSGSYIHGTVTSVSRVATSSSGGGGSSGSSGATLPVTISVSASGQGLDKAPVTVLFEQSRARNVLAIPVTALIATPGGGFAVEVVDATGHHQVPVTPGLYTSGYVQIDGAVQEGETVTNASA